MGWWYLLGRKSWLRVGVVLSIVGAGCGASVEVDSGVEALVEAVTDADAPNVFGVSFVPVSPSPYLACLQGTDEVNVAVDRNMGVAFIQARREVPPIMVTADKVFIGTGNSGRWWSIAMPAESDRAQVEVKFGTSLADFIYSGISEPSLNETVVALLDVATTVDASPTPAGVVGESFELTVDRGRYLSQTDGGDEESPIPQVTVSARVDGIVTGILVRPSSDTDDVGGPYMQTTNPQATIEIEIPDDLKNDPALLAEVPFPAPLDSCRFS